MRGTTPVSIRSWATPVERGGSGPSRSKYPAGDTSPASRASGSSRGNARSSAGRISVARAGVFLGLRRETRETVLVGLDRPPALRAPGQLVEPSDLALALYPGRVLRGQL